LLIIRALHSPPEKGLFALGAQGSRFNPSRASQGWAVGMKWIAHQIRLPNSSSTMAHQEGHSERVLRHIQLAADVLAKPLPQVRTLDLACLEGGFTFELAMQGAQAVGLEGRKENVDKCEAVGSQIGLSNCSFLHDDVRNLSKHKHGSFDVVLCLGILYHLTASDGVELLARMYDVCQRAVIIDTHVALFGEEQATVGVDFFQAAVTVSSRRIHLRNASKRHWRHLSTMRAAFG
jgi:Methyltransferase domain